MKRTLIEIAGLILIWAASAFAGWSPPMRLSDPGGHASPQIIAQGDTLHVVAEDFGPPDAIGYWRSTDGGESWSNTIILSDTANTGDIHDDRMIRYGSRLMVLWRYGMLNGSGFNIGYRISNNNGSSWGSISHILNPNWGTPLYFGATGYDFIINVIFAGLGGDSLYFRNARSTNFGQNWSSPVEIFGSFQSGRPDQTAINGIIHYVWAGCFSSDDPWDVFYIRSSDGGISWSNNLMISSPDQYHGYWPAICADGEGSVKISWMDYKYSPYQLSGDIFLRQSNDSGFVWDPEVQITSNHFAEISDIISSGDTIYITWEDQSQGLAQRSIYYTQSTDNGVTWEEPYWIDQTLDDSWNPALALSDGRVYSIWCDARYEPDSSRGGIYVSRWDPEPVGIGNTQNTFPEKMNLSVYPNPFNSSISIKYSNMQGGNINIYDVQGQLIKSYEIKGGENGKIIWDATDASGKKVSSGIYFARAETSQESQVVRLIYLK